MITRAWNEQDDDITGKKMATKQVGATRKQSKYNKYIEGQDLSEADHWRPSLFTE